MRLLSVLLKSGYHYQPRLIALQVFGFPWFQKGIKQAPTAVSSDSLSSIFQFSRSTEFTELKARTDIESGSCLSLS